MKRKQKHILHDYKYIALDIKNVRVAVDKLEEDFNRLYEDTQDSNNKEELNGRETS
jgi:hypothetical protein